MTCLPDGFLSRHPLGSAKWIALPGAHPLAELTYVDVMTNEQLAQAIRWTGQHLENDPFEKHERLKDLEWLTAELDRRIATR